jgi:single-stranded-DNA-specific exonuclease
MPTFWKISTKLKEKSPSKRRQEIVSSLLVHRNIKTSLQKKQFFSPPKPSSLTALKVGINEEQLSRAVRRIKQAIAKKELIYIYGDYDADGVCSTTILWENLYQLGAQVMPYIPFREDRVRGLSITGIKEIIAKTKTKPGLIITVDNGISAFAGCQFAQKQKIDVIISDHHLPKSKLPKAVAIVHTTKLAGAGVAWYLAYAINRQAVNSLDVACLGTIADMVPLISANRSFAKHGLEQMRKSSRSGVIALAAKANLNLATIDSHQVSFSLAPRLNAMARLEHALDSVRLMCLKNNQKAKKLADSLESTNQNRQEMTETMVGDALKKVDLSKKLLFVASKKFHEGIVGLVAGRLMERYYRPAVVVAVGKFHAKASARSIESFNLTQAIRSLKTPLLNHGGHKLAAGFTFEIKQLKALEKELVKLAEKSLTKKDLQPTLVIDCLLQFSDINWELHKELSNFEPFGMKNQQPLFASQKVNLVNFKAVGEGGRHLKLTLLQENHNFDAIAFGKGYLAPDLQPGKQLDVAYTVDVNHFNGNKSLQLKVKAIVSS